MSARESAAAHNLESSEGQGAHPRTPSQSDAAARPEATLPGPESDAAFDLVHALDVASRVDGLDAKLVAILHDALEDGACTVDDLIHADLPDEVIGAVSVLTRREGEAYIDYIERVRATGGELSQAVKLADLDTNLARLDEEHSSLEGRYRKAIRVLTMEVPGV